MIPCTVLFQHPTIQGCKAASLLNQNRIARQVLHCECLTRVISIMLCPRRLAAGGPTEAADRRHRLLVPTNTGGARRPTALPRRAWTLLVSGAAALRLNAGTMGATSSCGKRRPQLRGGPRQPTTPPHSPPMATNGVALSGEGEAKDPPASRPETGTDPGSHYQGGGQGEGCTIEIRPPKVLDVHRTLKK